MLCFVMGVGKHCVFTVLSNYVLTAELSDTANASHTGGEKLINNDHSPFLLPVIKPQKSVPNDYNLCVLPQ